MRYHRSVMLALLVCIAIGASTQNASAQSRTNYRYAQNAPPPAARSSVEELPMGAAVPGQMPPQTDAGGYVDGNFAPNPDHYYSGGPDDAGGYANACCEPCASSGCGETCGSSGCGSGCGSGGWGCGLGGGRWFVNAEYLVMRGHFSDALAYAERVDTTSQTTSTSTLNFHQLDFDYESSFRIGGGYCLACCGEEIAFNFTRFNSSADESVTAPDQTSFRFIEIPFNPFPAGDPADPFLDPGGPQSATIRASVDVNSYDFEWRKTIPLGGTSSSDCGNACGCGDCCQSHCPAWDITWSGGVRGAHVDWDRRYILTDDGTPDNNTDTRSELQFDGAGPRVGLEGRRYFGCDGWFSIFMKGNISLLYGQLELETNRQFVDQSPIDEKVSEFHAPQIIPVTEFEAGMAATVTCHSTISAGYMISSWHDLGFRDEPQLGTEVLGQQLVHHYDDANIMSFDGFFARYEWAY